MLFSRRSIYVAVLGVISTSVSAQNSEAVVLDTVFVDSQRSYDALATENSNEYTSPAATVGTKIPAPMREIPQSISIITNQQVKDRNVDTLDQLARKTPGLRVLSNDDGRSSIYARGYEYDEYNVDGLPAQMQSINGTLPNLVAFDRVEIMRGPSGLFDSSGEMGGIVNLVRKRPTKEFKASANLGLGTRRQYRLGADISGSLNPDGALRGRLLAETSGKSPEPAKQNNHHETVYAAIDWDVAPRTTVGLGYLYQQRDITPDNGLPAYANAALLPLPQDVFVGANWNQFNMESHDVFADIKHYFDNGAYGKIGLRYSDREADSNYAFAGSALNARNMVAATGLGTYIKQNAFAVDASYSQPFRWGNMANEFVVGADYNHFKTTNEQGRARLATNLDYRRFSTLGHADILGSARAGVRGYTRTVSEETLDESGLYGKLVIRPVDRLSLIVGGRVGHYEIDAGEGKSTNSDDNTKFTGYTGIVWDVTDNSSLYASYSSLYRSQTAIGKDKKLLKPRQGSQVEAGYKGSYLNEKLNTRLSFYRLKDKNAAASIVGDSIHYASLGERIMRGIELEVSGEMTHSWRVHAGYSYLDTDIKTASTTRDDGIFLLMPRHSFNLWTTYDLTDQLTLGGGVNAMSHIQSSAGVRGAGYATFDLMAAYRITPKLQFQLNVDNLFDRNYYTRVGSVNTFNIPGAERSITANLRYDFK